MAEGTEWSYWQLGNNANTKATLTQLNFPTGLAIDVNGNIYIVDNRNHIVRRIDDAGIISTVAGTAETPSLDGRDDGLATNARLCLPYGVVLDHDLTMYISDFGANVVRRVSNTGIISTIAGIAGQHGYTSDAGARTTLLGGPAGIALDQAGNVYIADSHNHIVRMVNDAGIITTIAGVAPGSSSDGGTPGTATSTALYSPQGIAIDIR